VGEQGRAERRVEVPRDGIVRVDLAVTSVIAEVHVRNARSGEPVTAGTVTIVPAGANCQSSIGRSQPASAERNGLSLRVSDGGCGLGELDAQGRARVALDAPGPHTVMLDIKRHRSLRQEIDLGTGTNVVELALTPEGAPVVRVRLHSDPPGLTGTLDCIQAQGQARSSYGGVSGTVDCGTFRPGPAEVIFRIDGFGLGRTALEVPEDGDIEVAVTAVRGGQLLLGGRADAAARPIVLDPSGLDWGGVLTRSGSGAIEAIDSPEVGPAWLLRYLPPGEYAVSLGGSSRGVVFIDPGSTTVVP
jgi:hypothetical protein